MKKDLKKFLYDLRIEAEVEIVEMTNTDISAYTYERTLIMEQRNQMLRELQLNKKQSLGVCFDARLVTSQLTVSVQAIVDHHHNVDAKVPTKVRFQEPGNQKNNEETKLIGGSPKAENKENTEKEAKEAEAKEEENDAQENKNQSPEIKKPTITPDEGDVRRMHTSLKLNEVIRKMSSEAQLVILNLPGPPRDTKMERESNYMEFLEVLTEGLERVLMVRGSGREVITIYS
ncbi:Solute carrier family 12 member 4 [Trachymyrmex zeteki]|uniref:Solute carrier family 12 member 4 n=1 Tax=Mycetomoellerius zeteki TaxID=64791 RepID=A0A151X3J5_9HYME|nr:Solute carrier family 12 member 4 [Trachymyrmex zeteki]